MRTVPPTEKGKYRAIASGAITNGKPVIVNSDGTVSSISSSSAITVYNAGTTSVQSVATNGSGTVVIAYRDDGNSNKGTAIVGTISGGEITFGSEAVFESDSVQGGYDYTISVSYDAASGKYVIVYSDGGNSNYPTAIVATVSGTSISFGTAVVIDSNNSPDIATVYDSSAEKIVVTFLGGSSARLMGAVGTVSGTSISFGTVSMLLNAYTSYIDSAYDSNANKTVVSFQDTNDNDGYAIVCTVSGTSISAGSATEFSNNNNALYTAIDFDSSANKVVISYNSPSLPLKAVVGTVSGTSISFGSETQFTSYGGSSTVAYDSTNNKTLIFFDDADSALKRIIGTVSGTSISFDTAVTLLSGNKGYTRAVYDSNNDTAIVVATDYANSQHGTAVLAGSGTFSASSTNLTTENYIGIANSCSFHGNTETITVTVAGGIFYLDGVANPVIQLLKGHTYIFDQADGTNNGHPLHFKDSGGSQYTTGVTVTGTAGSAGAKVTIEIASDATEPTRYYCTVHGNGMGNTINLSDSFVTVDTIGTVNDQQSSLTAGQQYFVQEDGTLGLTADSTSVFAGTAISATELVVKE